MAIQLQIRHGTNAENRLFVGAEAELSYDTEKQEVRVHDGVNAGGKILSVPVGTTTQFAGNTAPEGWLICDGSAISRTNYAALFSVISTSYGSGDGSTTFNLPNVSGRFVQGGTPGTTHNAGLPDITGNFVPWGYRSSLAPSGCFSQSGTSYDAYSASGNHAGSRIEFNAHSSNSIYGNSNTVQPKSIEMRFIIKY